MRTDVKKTAGLIAGVAAFLLAFSAPAGVCFAANVSAAPAVLSAAEKAGSGKTAAVPENASLSESGGTAQEASVPENTAEPDTTAQEKNKEQSSREPVKLRVSNWEEYIDLGDWDEEETIELPSGDIIGENSMIRDFEEWYLETYGIKVEVEYSTFGTNEDLYNMLTLGDVYDLVCPSEYLIMKLMSEQELVPLSDSFFDTSDEYNYYSKGVAPFIRNMFETSEIDGEPWAKYAAGYMWGVTGLVYNPELVSEDQVSSWKALADPAFKRQVTIKDSVRESYFAAVGAIKSDLLTSEAFRSAPDYKKQLEIEMNDTSPEMIGQVQDWLKTVKDNVYSFETDAGKADMITGKVAINYQWSGDAVYTLDQADEDDFTLCFAVPEESTDIYFDGWVMLKRGIEQDPRKQHAAEAFINFLSRPDNTIRNMYYIGYTSVLSGGDDPRILEYARYCYEAEDDEEDTVDYDLSYFFAEEGESGDYTITAAEDQMNRQLFSAYPPEDVIARSSIMSYFNDEQNAEINKMWVNVRCFDIRKAPIWGWFLFLAAAGVGFRSLVSRRKDR